MFRLVVFGLIGTIGMPVFDVVTMIGFGRMGLAPGISNSAPSFGDAARDGPLGVDVRERLMAGVERDARFCSAAALSGS